MRGGDLAARRAALRRAGFRESSSSRAATAPAAASISAIWVGNMSRNRPDMRQVTSTRGRPSAAGGSTSMPVTRPVAASHCGRQPISASPCAISSPPVRSEALPQRSMTSERGQSPCSCSSGAAPRRRPRWPSSKAVGVGMVRGSAVNRLRPVGSTSVRPRAGAPDGPAATWRPSSAASSACALGLGALPGAADRLRPRRRGRRRAARP